MFKHPSYYKKLRERNKSARVISEQQATASSMRAPGLGHEQQASSTKRQASSTKLLEERATSVKRQA